MWSIILYSGYDNSDARKKINIYKNGKPIKNDKLYVEALNQATISVDVDNYELEFREKFETKTNVWQFRTIEGQTQRKNSHFFNPKFLYK